MAKKLREQMTKSHPSLPSNNPLFNTSTEHILHHCTRSSAGFGIIFLLIVVITNHQGGGAGPYCGIRGLHGMCCFRWLLWNLLQFVAKV